MPLILNKTYVAAVVLVCMTALAFVAWAITAPVYREWSSGVPISGGWNWPVVIALDGLCLLGAAAVAWKLHADARTTVDDAGISRPSLLGATHIAWTGVTAIKTFGGQGIHIHAGKTRIVITPYAYRNPAAVVALIDRLGRPAHGAPRE